VDEPHRLQPALKVAPYSKSQQRFRTTRKCWLVTGAAGFIGSHLVEALLKLDQRVVGLDNFSTGKKANLKEVQKLVSGPQWARFKLIEGDIAELRVCRKACAKADYVLHQAALGSVPRSMEDPVATHQSNVTGFLNLLLAARQAGVARVVYASSSAVYGDDPSLPKIEDKIGHPLSPYAASKMIDEVYAMAFARAYGFPGIGLRYFNVFGPRQDPEGAYAAVIPKWTAALMKGEPVIINGDGETSRDFCSIENVVQANLLAATTSNPEALNQCYNIAAGQRTTLNELFHILSELVRQKFPEVAIQKPIYRDFRPGDVRHSHADVSKARKLLGYEPRVNLREELQAMVSGKVRNPKAEARKKSE
jgi:UDP-N-acetylglucosamine 4-epimerase